MLPNSKQIAIYCAVAVLLAPMCLFVAAIAAEEKNPQKELETVLPYFLKLLEEDKVEKFWDECTYPPKRMAAENGLGRADCIKKMRENSKALIILFRRAVKEKPELVKPPLKDELLARYEVGEEGTMNFRLRDGLWYVVP